MLEEGSTRDLRETPVVHDDVDEGPEDARIAKTLDEVFVRILL